MIKLILNLLFILTLLSQTVYATITQTKQEQFPNYGILQYFVPSQNTMNENFRPGKIITLDKNIITPKGVRYNIAEDEIECQINTQYGRISSPHKISEVEINGDLYVYKKYIYKGNVVMGYLQKIQIGQQNLYAKQFLKKYQNPHLKWDIKNVFFIEKAGGLPQQVNSLRTEILSIYKNQVNSANTFMRVNNYKWNDSKALIKLVNYLEKLTADNVVSR